MRSTKARSLKGGVRSVASVWAKNAPNRPSETTMSMAHRPSASKGRRTETDPSVIYGAAVDSERPEREVLRVEVVLQHEDAWEAGAVPPRVLPRAVRPLGPHEIIDAALDGGRARAAGGQQGEQRPRRLRGSRLTPPGQLGAVVGLARFAPAVVRVLVRFQPADRPLHVLLRHVLADGAEPAEHRPRAVDVVDTPAAEPRPV